jgi:DnaK suppressor protein
MMSEPIGDAGGEPSLSAGMVAELRRRLEGERAQLRAQIAELDAAFLDESWKEPRSDDDADTGTSTREREQTMSLAQNARALLAEIERALQRMDAGTYGWCIVCGRSIHPDRLEALPQARHCLDCRRRLERSIR